MTLDERNALVDEINKLLGALAGFNVTVSQALILALEKNGSLPSGQMEKLLRLLQERESEPDIAKLLGSLIERIEDPSAKHPAKPAWTPKIVLGGKDEQEEDDGSTSTET